MNFDFYKLDNGVRVILVPMEGVESVGVGVFVETGSRYETPKINGLSHFLEHMVFKGTKRFPTHQDTSYLEGLGAIQNAWTDVDATAYWCKIPADKWRQGLEVVKELAINPTFPNKDLEIERGVILEEINRRNDRPDEIVSEELQGLMFSGNPLEMTVLGEPDVIKTVSRDDFQQYHQEQYVAGRFGVVIVGKIGQLEEKKRVIEEWFGGLPSERGRDMKKFVVDQLEPRVKMVHKKLANQAHVELGFLGLTVSDPRRFELAVLTAYLGQGLSSRLFIEIREKRGLAYTVRADEQKLVDTGLWSVYAGLNIDKLEDALEAIVSELVRLKDKKISEADLVAAKEKIRGPLLFSAENPANQMNFYGKQILDRPEEVLSYKEIVEKIMSVDAESIQKVAQSILLRQFVNLAIVGPVDKKRQEKLLKIVSVL
jgi:predicted Zn-dependent peptidase